MSNDKNSGCCPLNFSAVTKFREHGLRSTKNFLKFLIFFLTLITTHVSSMAALISYTTSVDANSRWTYQYSIAATSSELTIEEFSIFFDPSLYANLTIESYPTGWDTLVIQPDTTLPADGFMDALTLGDGIIPGQQLNGFAVSFDYLANGIPNSQRFNIIDPVTFSTISSGLTLPEVVTTVPEPTTGWLITFLIPLLYFCRYQRPATYL